MWWNFIKTTTENVENFLRMNKFYIVRFTRLIDLLDIITVSL